jgi:uncharacterized repeat protein (TIGR01451 family)
MNIENLTVSGPPTGFQICTNSTNTLFGILFEDASGSVSNVTVEHIWQQPTASPSCNAGTAIRVENPTAARTVTIMGTTVVDYQKNGIDGRGSTTTMDVSGSTIGPPNNQEGLIAANGLVYVGGATGTATGNTIFGSGDQQPPGPPGGGTDATAVLLFGADNVTITKNTITGAKTDIGVSVTANSTGSVISFNQIGRTAPDDPDPTGHGIDVTTFDGSMATPICNTFSNWNINIVGAQQIACTSLPPGKECQAYSAPTPSVDSGNNWDPAGEAIVDTEPFTWTVDSGTLPPGLSLSSAGAITGTPTAAGTFDFTVKLVDSTGLTATQAETITIASGTCPSPGILLVKSASVSRFSASGTVVTYSFKVSNTGTQPLSNVVVTDPLGGLSPISCPANSLAIGASITCTATYSTTSADVAHGTLTNTATATSTDSNGVTVGPSTSTVTIPAATAAAPAPSPAPAPVSPITQAQVQVTG